MSHRIIVLLLVLFFPRVGLALQPGDLVISEIMANPDGVPDSLGEWFELYNQGSPIADLRGLVVSDESGATHSITGPSPIPLGSFQFFVLGRSDDLVANDGAPVDHVYDEFILNNGGDTIRVLDGATLVAIGTYGITSSGLPMLIQSQPAPGVGGYEIGTSLDGMYGQFNFGTPGAAPFSGSIPGPPALPVPIGNITRVTLLVAAMVLGSGYSRRASRMQSVT